MDVSNGALSTVARGSAQKHRKNVKSRLFASSTEIFQNKFGKCIASWTICTAMPIVVVVTVASVRPLWTKFHDNKCMAHFVIIYLFHFIQTDKSYLILSTHRAKTHAYYEAGHNNRCVCVLGIWTLDSKIYWSFSFIARELTCHYRSDDYFMGTSLSHTQCTVKISHRTLQRNGKIGLTYKWKRDRK